MEMCVQEYAVGLDAQRHSAVLHANAALASLRVKAYVQAIEHCDKACAALAQKGSKPRYLQLLKFGQSSMDCACTLGTHRSCHVIIWHLPSTRVG